MFRGLRLKGLKGLGFKFQVQGLGFKVEVEGLRV